VIDPALMLIAQSINHTFNYCRGLVFDPKSLEL